VTPRNQAGALQHLRMLGYRRLTEIEGFRDFVDRGFAGSKPPQDRAARSVGKCRKRSVERICASFSISHWLYSLTAI
jgi:hypothetical protein